MSGRLNNVAICGMLEIPMSSLQPLTKAMDTNNYETAQDELDKFKLLVKKQRRVLAKKYHPDMTGGSEEKMKHINNCVDFIKKIRITTLPRPRPTGNVDTPWPSDIPTGGYSYSYRFSFGIRSQRVHSNFTTSTTTS